MFTLQVQHHQMWFQPPPNVVEVDKSKHFGCHLQLYLALKTDVNTKSNRDLSQTHLQILAGSDTIQSMNQSPLQHSALHFRVALKLTDTSV